MIGTMDFEDLLINNNLFIDKTLMINHFIESKYKTMIITYPRRWGKSK